MWLYQLRLSDKSKSARHIIFKEMGRLDHKKHFLKSRCRRMNQEKTDILHIINISRRLRSFCIRCRLFLLNITQHQIEIIIHGILQILVADISLPFAHVVVCEIIAIDSVCMSAREHISTNIDPIHSIFVHEIASIIQSVGLCKKKNLGQIHCISVSLH